jgi:hypothetical protein
MDHFCKEALWRLGRSIESSGEIIGTVSRWPANADFAKQQHINGALANAERVVVAAKIVAAI